MLRDIDPTLIEHHDGNCNAGLRILVSVEGDDARLLEQMAKAQGGPRDVVA